MKKNSIYTDINDNKIVFLFGNLEIYCHRSVISVLPMLGSSVVEVGLSVVESFFAIISPNKFA